VQPRLPPSQKLGVIRVFFGFMKIDTNFRQLQSVIFHMRENDNIWSAFESKVRQVSENDE
jgi:hypothetical protein